MKRAREISAANERLGNHRGSNALECVLIGKFYPMYQAHAVENRGDEAFVEHLGYLFINCNFSPVDDNAAMKLFMQNFDTHVQLQEENYLVQHEKLRAADPWRSHLGAAHIASGAAPLHPQGFDSQHSFLWHCFGCYSS